MLKLRSAKGSDKISSGVYRLRYPYVSLTCITTGPAPGNLPTIKVSGSNIVRDHLLQAPLAICSDPGSEPAAFSRQIAHIARSTVKLHLSVLYSPTHRLSRSVTGQKQAVKPCRSSHDPRHALTVIPP